MRSGDWEALYGDVYICGGTPIRDETRAWAALLAVRQPAGLYGGWAAWAHGMDRVPDVTGSAPEVVVRATRRADGVEGVRVVRSRQPLVTVITVGGLAAVPPQRALRQLAASTPRSQVRDVLHHALRRRVVTVTALERELGRGLPGAGLLRSLLEEVAPGYQVVWEGRLHRALVAAGLQLEPQVRVAVASGYRVLDLGDRRLRLGVEVDGFVSHLDRFAADKRRDRELIRAGWVIIHVAVSELADGLDAVVRDLASSYLQRRAELCAAAGH